MDKDVLIILKYFKDLYKFDEVNPMLRLKKVELAILSVTSNLPMLEF